MAITYTDNFSFPLLSDGSSNWGSVANGAMETLDIEIKAAQTPIISMATSQVLVNKRLGTVLLKHFDND